MPILKRKYFLKQVALLKEANVKEEDIRRFIMKHCYEPLARLNAYQNSGMIESAEIFNIENTSYNDLSQ